MLKEKNALMILLKLTFEKTFLTFVYLFAL